jgi:hypothetical protein
MKNQRLLGLLAAAGFLAAVATAAFAQADMVKTKAKDLRKQLEQKGGTTNAPAKPKPPK